MDYIFQKAQDKKELERLLAIEKVFDPASRRRMKVAGIEEGSRCLEVGAGAGSIMRWLAEQAGPSGHVTALDINTRFLANPPPTVHVVAGDVRSMTFDPDSFDLVHARYVLVHIPEYKKVLESLWRVLKPGGALVIEEPDFTAYRGLSGAELQSFNNVHHAIIHMFNTGGVDPALGLKLPILFQEVGAKNVAYENDSPLSCGGSDLAKMMNLSAAHLKERYLATGKVTVADLEAYARFTQSPDSWAIYYATVGAIGHK
jgi:SAM-dependent methyltransferase